MRQATERVLVVGATGFLGHEITRLLCGGRKTVRALVREDARPDRRAGVAALPVEVVPGDLKVPSSLAAACQGQECVVSTATAIVSRRAADSIASVDDAGQRALVRAAAEAGVRHFVFVSFVPNELDYAFQSAKRAVERELHESAMTYTILQPTAFMEVWLSPMLGFDPAAGKARILGDGTRPVSWVSLRDVARLAAAAVEGGAFAGKTIAFGGPDALSPAQVIGLCEEVCGRKLSVEHLPEPVIEGMFRAASDPVQQAQAAGMLTIARGQVVKPQGLHDLLPGQMTTVREHLARLLGRTTN